MANHWQWMPYRSSDGRVPDREPLRRQVSPLPMYESVQAKLDAVFAEMRSADRPPADRLDPPLRPTHNPSRFLASRPGRAFELPTRWIALGHLEGNQLSRL